MSPTAAIVHHRMFESDTLERRLMARGIRAMTWFGFGEAHAFISRRHPDLVLICAESIDRDAARRLMEELSWDPETSDIPVILQTIPEQANHEDRCSGEDLDELESLIAALAGSETGSSSGRTRIPRQESDTASRR